MRLAVASEVLRVLKRMGFGSAHHGYARDARPVNGLMPVVADVNRLRVTGSPQVPAGGRQPKQDKTLADGAGAPLAPVADLPAGR